MKVAGIKANVSRSGYTGEDGYEISAAANKIGEIWDTLLLDGTVKPIGLGARDSLRLEAGLCLYGHEDVANRGGWPKVPATAASLKPDAQGPDVVALKQRLLASGDLAPEAVAGDTYDANVTEAVKRFQRRHGLISSVELFDGVG